MPILIVGGFDLSREYSTEKFTSAAIFLFLGSFGLSKVVYRYKTVKYVWFYILSLDTTN